MTARRRLVALVLLPVLGAAAAFALQRLVGDATFATAAGFVVAGSGLLALSAGMRLAAAVGYAAGAGVIYAILVVATVIVLVVTCDCIR